MAAPPRTIMSSARTAAGVGPVPGQERIDAIDVLRGVAILGILIVNMGLFNHAEDLPAHGVVDRLLLCLGRKKKLNSFFFVFLGPRPGGGVGGGGGGGPPFPPPPSPPPG